MPQLNFRGKPFVQNLHFTVPYHELIPQKDKSLTAKVSLHDNLIVHGDNLLALKALLPTYGGKVKCIYIDPPYNTGNEGWAYNDNVNSPIMKEWLGKTVDREDLTRHDKWLCMMTPRLKLLRELLRDDGVIFISIDDNEVHHLRMLMDEIFGEENFVATVIWHKMDSPKNTAVHFSEDHDYIIIYAKDGAVWRPNALARTDAMVARYKNPDNDSRGPWLLSDLAARNFYAQGRYPITTSSGRVIEGPPAGSYWRVSKEKFDDLAYDIKARLLMDDFKEPAGSPKEFVMVVQNLETGEYYERNGNLVLGSGTTAQAVLQLNKEDGGNRKFVLIEMEGYADKLTAERVRRVIKGVPASKNEALKNGLGGTLSFFELGKPIEVDSILSGKNLPSYKELARYVFFTGTGEEFDESKINEKAGSIGESKEYQVYLLYKPDVEYLRKTALTLDFAEQMAPRSGKKRLVFAPTKYLSQDQLDEHRILFAQLPFARRAFANIAFSNSSCQRSFSRQSICGYWRRNG
ncbi:MAG: Type III restriction-modification system methyltransferase, partial [Candidatus Jorgensenbacteria bacterium GW2011_GWA2_45_9]